MKKEGDISCAILISGSGSTAEAILRARKKGELDGINPVAVIASRPDSAGITKAQNLGFPVYVLERRGVTAAVFASRLHGLLLNLHVELISQNGWLPLTPSDVVAAYRGRIINQHPGPLDPGRTADFGGKGMYGSRVTCARLAYSWLTQTDPWTEATVHHVNQEFDKGSLIAVSRVELPQLPQAVTVAELTTDMRGTLIEATLDIQATLLPYEHALVIDTLRTIGESKIIPSYSRGLPLIPDARVHVAENAKNVAIQVFPQG